MTMLTTTTIDDDRVHLENFLSSSGLTPADVPGWHFMHKAFVNSALGIDKESRNKINCDAVTIPYLSLSGSPLIVNGVPHMRLRLLGEKFISKNGGKYRSRSGSGSHLYIPAGFKLLLDNLHGTETCLPLVVTEGEKKAEALCKAGIPAVAVAGVAMGLVRASPDDKESPRVLIPELVEVVALYYDTFNTKSSVVVVLFDNDGCPQDYQRDGLEFVVVGKTKKWVSNKNVFYEADALARALRERFAESELPVAGAWCPVPDDFAKMGVDDWLLRDGVPAVTASIIKSAAAARAADLVKIAARRERRAAASQGGYSALGHTHEGMAVWSVPQNRVVTMTPAALSRGADIMAATGSYFALCEWPKSTKEDAPPALDVSKACVQIIDKCHRAGMWSAGRERGGGVWLEDGSLILNTAQGLFEATPGGLDELSDDARHTGGKYVYPANNSYHINPEVARTTAAEAEQIALAVFNHCNQWGWTNSQDPLLMAGWILAQAYLGALDARPSITLCGASGAGKSVLAQHVSDLLGGTAWRIDDGANSTAAGIRQKVGRDAVTLLIDESEPGSSDARVAQQRASTLRQVLNMLRASYSVSDGARGLAAVKGSVEGKAVEFSVRTAAMLAAIGRPDFEQADRNRFIVLEVNKEGRAASEPTAAGLDELGENMRHAMWARWTDFQKIYTFLVEHAGAACEVEARLVKTWGVPLAAFTVLAEGASVLATDEGRSSLLEAFKIIAVEQQSTGGQDASETDADRALRTLIGARMTIEKVEMSQNGSHVLRLERTVLEAFVAAKKDLGKATQHDNFFATGLKRVGLARMEPAAAGEPPRLFIADCPELRVLLRNTSYKDQSINNLLIRLPGATQTRSRTHAGRVHGISILMPFDSESLTDTE